MADYLPAPNLVMCMNCGNAVNTLACICKHPLPWGAMHRDGVPEQAVVSNDFESILSELKALHDKKGADYGQGQDPLANVRASQSFGVPAWVGVAIRMNDKMVRIQSFCQKGKLENESLEDSIIDIAIYAVIMLQLYREQGSNK